MQISMPFTMNFFGKFLDENDHGKKCSEYNYGFAEELRAL